MIDLSSLVSVLVVLLIALRSPAVASGRAAPGRVLLMLSGADALGLQEGRVHPTGHFLGELAEPLEMLLAAGFAVDCASPDGRAPRIDQDSLRWIYWWTPKRQAHKKQCLELVRTYGGLTHPRALASLTAQDLDEYVAVFVPGGHAPMADLAANFDVARILMQFHQAGKPIGLICHAPVTLLSLAEVHPFPFAGYRVTVFSTVEEKLAEKLFLHGRVLYYPEEALKSVGLQVTNAVLPNVAHSVVDRELVSGQNPYSPKSFGQNFLEAIRRYQAQGVAAGTVRAP